MRGDYGYYNRCDSGYFTRFLQRNAEFATVEFRDYVLMHNRGDRDSGEFDDIAKHEVLRLAAEFSERMWRFPNVYGKAKE